MEIFFNNKKIGNLFSELSIVYENKVFYIISDIFDNYIFIINGVDNIMPLINEISPESKINHRIDIEKFFKFFGYEQNIGLYLPVCWVKFYFDKDKNLLDFQNLGEIGIEENCLSCIDVLNKNKIIIDDETRKEINDTIHLNEISLDKYLLKCNQMLQLVAMLFFNSSNKKYRLVINKINFKKNANY